MSEADSSAALGYEPSNGGAGRRVWVPLGGARRVGALSEHERKTLVSAVLDVRPDPETRLVLLGVDVDGLRPAGRAALRDRIAFLPADGGLLSSLNAWENIVLPIGFHTPRRLAGVDAAVHDALEGLVDDPGALLAKLPERMTAYEKNLIGYVRITLEKADLVLAEEAQGELGSVERAAAGRFPELYLERCPGATYVRLEVASG